MSNAPFMPLWVSDFLGDTLDLDATEVGAYMLLLMAQWNRDGESLPSDQKKLQRVARCGREWGKVWGNISRYFITDENGIYSKRLRFEAQNVAAKREVNARNGALGGSAKALKNIELPLANATHSLQRKSSIPEPEPELERKKEKDIVGFDEFWASFPACKRKTDKPKAKRVFDSIVAGKNKDIGKTEAATIIAGIKAYAAGDLNPEYIPLPTTWLNGARWEKEVGDGSPFADIAAKNKQQEADLMAKTGGKKPAWMAA